MIYTDIETTIRNKLIADTTLFEYFRPFLSTGEIDLNKRIRIGHISSIAEPLYPCITFKAAAGGMSSNQFTVTSNLHIDIWSKDLIDTSIDIYGIIRDIINLKKIDGAGIAQIIETGYEDGLFENTTQTHHVAALYEVTAINI